MRRLKSLYVKDFRSIDGEINISLDAPIVLIHGPNGAGKTSLLSAIELALTGAVPSLSRAEPNYLAYLPHRDRPFGEVRLGVSEANGAVRSSSMKVTTSKVTGTPFLGEAEANFFSDRSYLAQSTLGRLLEIYQHSERKSDSPLTRFVKELLGLDRMEALIKGLHSAGNISRLKIPVPAFASVRHDILENEATLQALTRQEAEITDDITSSEKRLKEQLDMIDPVLADSIPDSSELFSSLSEDPEEAALVGLLRARREIELSESVWAQINMVSGTSDRTKTEAAYQSAQSAFSEWTRLNGVQVEALLARASVLFADVAVTGESSYSERARSLAARVQADHARIQSTLDAHEQALQLRNNLGRQISEAKTRLDRLEGQISAATNTNESLARSLSDLNMHIDGNICPVCDRDYSEIGSTPLASHISSKISTMVEQAGRLQSLAKDQSATNVAVTQLKRQMATAEAELLLDVDLNKLKSRAPDMTEISRQLADAMSLLNSGDSLREEAARLAKNSVALKKSDQSIVALRDGLEKLASHFGVISERDVPTGSLLRSVKTKIQESEKNLTEKQRNRRIALETVASLVELKQELTRLNTNRSEAQSRLKNMRFQRDKAEGLIKLAKDVVKLTQEARGRVVRRAFNDELNAVWRDLFIRLAPEEPFVPAFAIPEASDAEIEAVLETHHRRGGKGGNPLAMLSAGNLNTAALTLFLALHLSVKAKLPWLVIDDPVQSMDEVHIAQFSALLRTLSKQMNRQVIIAVHERSLFEYLALELSPAFEGDRLNIIELGRNAIGQTTCTWDTKVFIPDKAIVA